MRRRGAVLVLLIAVALAACQGGENQLRRARVAPRKFIVASFNFAESILLAEIYATALGNAGIPVARDLDIGPREIVAPALEQGLVDLVPEYLGSSLAFVTLGEAIGSSDPARLHRSLRRAYARRSVEVLAYAPAQDVDSLAVTQETAEEHDLEAISDLGPVAGRLALGGAPECPHRPLCLAGLERVYGLHFASFRPLDVAGPLTVAALTSGEIDVAVLTSTHPSIEKESFVLLEDDRDLQPAQNVVPVVRRRAAERLGPQVVARIDEVTSHLTTEDLRSLNAQLAIGERPRDVASAWLASEGLL